MSTFPPSIGKWQVLDKFWEITKMKTKCMEIATLGKLSISERCLPDRADSFFIDW